MTADSGCSWTAVSNGLWITIDSGSSGNGDGTVNYSVSENTSTQFTHGHHNHCRRDIYDNTGC